MAIPTLLDRIQTNLEGWEPGAKLLRSWPLNGGISATMTAFEVESADGTRRKMIARQPSSYRLKQNSDAASREFNVHAELKRLGLPVQTPFFVEAASTDITDPFFTLEYIEGAPELNPSNPAAFIVTYARRLAQLHRQDLAQISLSNLPGEEEIGPRPETLNELLREGEIRDALAVIAPCRKNQKRLLHGDFWPGNLLWRDGELAAIIDWEEILVGDPLMDLAICRLDLWWILGEDASNRFTFLYQEEAGLDLTDLPYWDLRTALRPIRNIGQWSTQYPKLGRPDVNEASMSRDHLRFTGLALQKFN